jgi:hypothetical protein
MIGEMDIELYTLDAHVDSAIDMEMIAFDREFLQLLFKASWSGSEIDESRHKHIPTHAAKQVQV